MKITIEFVKPDTESEQDFEDNISSILENVRASYGYLAVTNIYFTGEEKTNG
jgi:hypothetical protein